MICFHGTTSKGYKAIMSGDGCKPSEPWLCSSFDGAMYVWPVSKLDDSEEPEEGIRKSFESAQVQAVVSDDYLLYALELEIPDELLEDDLSAENMSDSASYIPISEFSLDMIKKVYVFQANKWHAPFIVSGLLSNDHFNKWSIDEDLLAVAENLESVYIEEMYQFDYSEIEL